MITLETGVPGAGKTLYCVDKLLRSLVGAKVKHEDSSGNIVEVERTIYTNVNGLLLDHVKIGPGAEWSFDGKTKTWSQAEAGGQGLNNWHEWAKPGAVIVYDEIQKPWPLAAAGSPVPPCITALETHRHMGVDFIVLTQHPMLIHANLVRLVGRHLHIRRMGNLGLAVVYEWDSASRTLLYKNALAKAPYRYDKSVFDLYKSAELHTKQPRRMPSLIWGIALAFGLMAYFGPSSYARIAERINPSATAAKPAKAASGPMVVPPIDHSLAAASAPAPAAPMAPASVPEKPRIVAGCVVMGPRCTCFDTEGAKMPLTGQSCLDASMQTDRVTIAGNSAPFSNGGSRAATPLPPSSAPGGNGSEPAGAWLPADRPYAAIGSAGPRPGIAP